MPEKEGAASDVLTVILGEIGVSSYRMSGVLYGGITSATALATVL